MLDHWVNKQTCIVIQICLFTQWSNICTSTFYKNFEASICCSTQRRPRCYGLYLNDSILFGDSCDECKAAVFRAVSLFQRLGFQVHLEKSSLTPEQETNFLGFTINSKNMILKLTKQKCNKILVNLDLTLTRTNNITIREFSKILSILEAAISGVKYGCLPLFYSTKCRNQALTLSKESYDCYFKLSSESVVKIYWWKATIAKSYNTIHSEIPKKIIYSDACPNDWGFHENMSS